MNKVNSSVPNYSQIAQKSVDNSSEGIKRARYHAINGVTPPTKDIYNRFYRKDFPIPKNKIQEIESEMIDLLKVK